MNEVNIKHENNKYVVTANITMTCNRFNIASVHDDFISECEYLFEQALRDALATNRVLG